MNSAPDEKRCRELMDRYGMWPNIVEHSYRVCQVALFLCSRLNRNGAALHPELILAASLLHDITKARSIETKENHADTGRVLLLEIGYPEVAEIVGSHIRVEPGAGSLPISDAHLVNYTDKRVRHSSVVSLQERFEDLQVRYGIYPAPRERIERLKAEIFRMEERLFEGLGFAPSDLVAFNALSAFDLSGVPDSLL